MTRLEGLPGGINGGASRRTLVDADSIAEAVIGRKIRIRGSIEGESDLRVDGHVEGTIRLSATLHIEQGGVVEAEIQARSTVVEGTVRGDVHATESVHIATSGKMVGDIIAPRVIIDDGAAFRGRIDMGCEEATDEPSVEEAEVPLPLASGE